MWPKLPLARRQALGPVHRFLGLTVLLLGLAAMGVGLQEKATFLQLGAGAGLRSAALALPAAMQVFLALIATGVMAHYAFGGKPPPPTEHTERAPLHDRWPEWQGD